MLTTDGEKIIRAAAPGHARLVQELVVKPLTAVQFQRLGEADGAVVEAIDMANRSRKQDTQVAARPNQQGG